MDKYIIIHAHGHQPQEEKLAFKKVAGSSAAKWRLVLFGYASFQSSEVDRGGARGAMAPPIIVPRPGNPEQVGN